MTFQGGTYYWEKDLELSNSTGHLSTWHYFTGTVNQDVNFGSNFSLQYIFHETPNILVINGNVVVAEDIVSDFGSTTFNGDLTINNGELLFDNDSVNTFNGTVNFLSNSTIRLLSSGATASFSGDLSTVANLSIINTGIITLANFDGATGGSFNNSGNFSVVTGKTVNFTNHTSFDNTGIITEDGVIIRPSDLLVEDNSGNPGQIFMGNYFTVFLTDDDENVDGSVDDSVIIQITNLSNGDAELLLFDNELGSDSGVFYKSINSIQAGANSGDGILQGMPGDQIEITYTDNEDPSDVRTIVIDTASPVVNLSINNKSIAENSGTANVTASLTYVWGQDVTVNLNYSGSSSTGAADFTAPSSIVIPAGSVSSSVALIAIDDVLDEIDEDIIIDIDSVSNGVENGIQQVSIDIIDDDAPPVIDLVLTGGPIVEAGGIAILTATPSVPSGYSITVNLSYTGQAINSVDYSGVGSITIPAEAIDASISLVGIIDNLNEVDETLIIDITTVVNASENGVQTQSTNIIDDDTFSIVTRQTNDSNNNGRIDRIRLLFSGSVNDSTVQIADFNLGGGRIINAIETGLTIDDNEIFLLFDESMTPDTEDTPDVTYTAGSLVATGGAPLSSDGGAVTAADAAPPILMRATAILAGTNLKLGFSEPVSNDGSGGNLEVSDFNYGEIAIGDATDVLSVGADNDASDGTLALTVDFAFSNLDLGNDTLACANNQVYDNVGNAAPVTPIIITRLLDILSVTINGNAIGSGALSMTANLPIDPTIVPLDAGNNWNHSIDTDDATTTILELRTTDDNGLSTDTIILDEQDVAVGGG